MTNVVKSVSIWGQVYPFGWGSEWQEVVYLTQAEYDALPASKLTDGKIYKIKTSGVAPTPGGGTAVERGDMVLLSTWTSVGWLWVSDIEWVYIVSGTTSGSAKRQITAYDIYWNNIRGQTDAKCQFTINNKIIVAETSSSTSNWYIYQYDTTNWTETHSGWTLSAGMSSATIWTDWEHFIFKKGDDYKWFDLECNDLWEVPEDKKTIPWLWSYYKWLYYSVDWNDIVAKNSTWTEVKRYEWIYPINALYNDVLYKQIGDVAYAVATI